MATENVAKNIRTWLSEPSHKRSLATMSWLIESHGEDIAAALEDWGSNTAHFAKSPFRNFNPECVERARRLGLIPGDDYE